METIILSILLIKIIMMALWITIGALDNILHPSINEDGTSDVMNMTHMKSVEKRYYDMVSRRRIKSDKNRKIMFGIAVFWEVLSCIMLWVSGGLLIASVFDIVSVEFALLSSLIATSMFTSTWAGFLVLGNWFLYWICHDECQKTHFHMNLWGLVNIVIILLCYSILVG